METERKKAGGYYCQTEAHSTVRKRNLKSKEINHFLLHPITNPEMFKGTYCNILLAICRIPSKNRIKGLRPRGYTGSAH